MIDALIGVAALILIFFLPGFLLTLAIFPGRGGLHAEFDLLFKSVLGVALSLLIAILVGILLSYLGELTGESMIRARELWISLGAAALLFGAMAWLRGGLKELAEMAVPRGWGRRSAERRLSALVIEKRALQEKLAQLDSPEYRRFELLVEEAEVRRPVIIERIEEINREIERIAGELEGYGGDDAGH